RNNAERSTNCIAGRSACADCPYCGRRTPSCDRIGSGDMEQRTAWQGCASYRGNCRRYTRRSFNIEKSRNPRTCDCRTEPLTPGSDIDPWGVKDVGAASARSAAGWIGDVEGVWRTSQNDCSGNMRAASRRVVSANYCEGCSAHGIHENSFALIARTILNE